MHGFCLPRTECSGGSRVRLLWVRLNGSPGVRYGKQLRRAAMLRWTGSGRCIWCSYVACTVSLLNVKALGVGCDREESRDTCQSFAWPCGCLTL